MNIGYYIIPVILKLLSYDNKTKQLECLNHMVCVLFYNNNNNTLI